MRFTSTFSVLTISLLTLVGCGKNQTSTTQDTATPAAATKASPAAQDQQALQNPSKLLAIGETVVLGKYKFTVNSVRNAVGDSVSKPQKGQKYLIVNATVENLGQKKAAISSILLFTLTDSTNKKYKRVITTETKGSLDANLDPGKKLQGEISFEVPQDAKDLLLILRGDVVEPSLQAKVKLN